VRDFVDALSVAQMERLKIEVIASFDHDFDRFPGIRRQEP
jgi:predicted nucleic acid-binding protein